MIWRPANSNAPQEDTKRLAASGLKPGTKELLDVLRVNPFQSLPPFEKLVGDLSRAYSRHIDIWPRLVCQVLQEDRSLKVFRVWSLNA